MENKSYTLDSQENIFKQFYMPTSICEDEEAQDLYIDHDVPPKKMKRKAENIDSFFEMSPKSKRKLSSSTVARANKDTGTSYISTNADDGATSTHLIKLEVYDLKKISKIPLSQHWKHAAVKIKYYTQKSSKILANTNDLIFDITKEIAETEGCKKYSFNN